MRLSEPSVALRLHACALILIGALNLGTLVGPAIVINAILGAGEGLDRSRSWDSLQIYAEQVAELKGLETGMVFYLLFVSFLVSCIYLVSGALLFFRGAWVKRPLLCSLVIVLLLFIVSYVIVASMKGLFWPTLHSIVIYLVVPIALLHRLTRADAKRFFAGEA